MQFKVPQFLEIEDKIFGPFTFREFIYLVGGGGLCFTLYKLLGLFWGIIPILIVAGLSLLLTFYRPNNKPFVDVLESGFKYLIQNKLYIWKKTQVKKSENAKELKSKNNQNEIPTAHKRLSESRLRDLAWSLDVLDLDKQKKEN